MLNQRALWRSRPGNFIRDSTGVVLGPINTIRPSTMSRRKTLHDTRKRSAKRPPGFISLTTGLRIIYREKIIAIGSRSAPTDQQRQPLAMEPKVFDSKCATLTRG